MAAEGDRGLMKVMQAVDTARQVYTLPRRAQTDSRPAEVALMFKAMPDKVHSECRDYRICDGKGTVPSRLPCRMKLATNAAAEAW